MTVPAAVGTTHLDAGTDSPQAARADLLDLTQKFNTLREHLVDTNAGISAGVHAMAITSIVNASSVVMFSGQYIRVGTEVQAAFGISVVASAAGSVSFRGSLPVSSNFTTTGDGVGSGCASGPGSPVPLLVVAVSPGVMGYMFVAPAAGTYTVVGTYMYRVQ